ncbi:hypothetical protein [Staphylococcus massiliensis]|uniref:Uncharacterized protein n=1 Tax=Staphylococcus massiliensis S46 TaxID=1229783 RepID=K9AS82_9STAP|nr:hypothetical protein [Staphylococcus massiliensis]EKU50278.1 hypothetical protein C273_01510 [Staphylococcus massiliensis S46]MCG3399696.1 hypothetical protein [Staphylococcus massiliensis]MCG3400801.1 hypothetical protein [Staphylococcus massiliensis]MCG3412035.1 hypothetical protein [Staphylococcus massiliensis]PNZ96845.1 hypothetical protein CD133_11445 [Staphylococcus massiliensis CCUG 55927]
MFRDLGFYIFGHQLDKFIQYFIFELLIITLLAVIATIFLKKAWVIFAVVIVLNLIDITIIANFDAGGQGIGAFFKNWFTLFLAKLFPMFYEILLAMLITNLPFMRKKFNLA